MSVTEPELITIVEGPPPEFQLVNELWPFSLWEGRLPQSVGYVQMRTFSGPSMVDRCTRAWDQARPVMLDFPQMDGLRRRVEVLAARATTLEQGDVLNLWVALPADEVAASSAGADAADDGDNLETDF